MRQWHRWISLITILPLGLTTLTGILLMTRGFNSWVQPQAQAISSPVLAVSWEQMLESLKSHPELDVQSWKDVSQIDVRPGGGQIRVRFKSHHLEAQVDPVSGELLQVAPRMSALLIQLHEGAYFGPWVRYGLFLPAGVGLLVLYLTGTYLFFQFIRRKYFK